MNRYMIEPWDQETPGSEGSDMHVPAELEQLARTVADRYKMKVQAKRLITSKPDKGGAIWKIDTDQGPRSLKVLHREPRRSLFSVGAQEYLVQRGARVPALIPDREGNLSVEAGGKIWIVTDWIEPLTQASKVDLEGAQVLCRGLGEFHRLSRGYEPPPDAERSSRLYKWPQYYTKIWKKIGWFREVARVYNEVQASPKLLEAVDRFERQALDSLIHLEKSPYRILAAQGESYWGLVHQDYGWSNGQLGPGGVWIIDLDGVAYDLPIRDLQKLITSTMDDLGVWDTNWIRGMIGSYHETNPLNRETYEILMMDLALPNGFYKHVKDILYDPKLFLQTEIEPILEHVLRCEESKWSVLKELSSEQEAFPSGDYQVQSIHDFHLPQMDMTRFNKDKVNEPVNRDTVSWDQSKPKPQASPKKNNLKKTNIPASRKPNKGKKASRKSGDHTARSKKANSNKKKPLRNNMNKARGKKRVGKVKPSSGSGRRK